MVMIFFFFFGRGWGVVYLDGFDPAFSMSAILENKQILNDI